MFAGKIYSIGGQTGTNDATGNHADVFAWDPATNSWSSAASLPAPLSHIGEAPTVAAGRLFVAGGITAGGDVIAEVDRYDATLDAWQPTDDLPGARFSGALVEVDGVLYFTGGSTQTTTWRGVFTG